MHLSSAKHVSSRIITILKLDSRSPAWFADSFSKSRPPKGQGQRQRQRYHEVVVFALALEPGVATLTYDPRTGRHTDQR